MSSLKQTFDMMILLRLWLIVSLTASAPINSNVDKEAEEDLTADDIVGGDGMNSDRLHNHTSQNASRDAKHIHGGNINFSGTIHSTGDHARINIGSIFINDLYPQESHDEPDHKDDTTSDADATTSEADSTTTDAYSTTSEPDATTSEPDATSSTEGTVVAVCAADEQFSCRSGECINMDFRCDGDKECKDGSDEEECPLEDCENDNKNEIACSCKNPTGMEESACSAGQRCNEDGTCQDDCKEDEFSCLTVFQCVQQNSRCDGEVDCNDDSDEENCQNSEKRRKRSTQTITIRGKIVLPADMNFTFITNSRVYVSCDDLSNLQSTNLGIAVIDVSNKLSEEDISYVLEIDLPNSEQITMSATINVGWKRDPSSGEWIRKGDFHNDVSHSLYVVKDTVDYEKDVSVVLYDY